MHVDRAGEAERRVLLAQPEQEAGEGQHDQQRDRDRGVELLAGIEPALLGRAVMANDASHATLEPLAVGAVERVDLLGEGRDVARPQDQDADEGDAERDREPEVPLLGEWAVHYLCQRWRPQA